MEAVRTINHESTRSLGVIDLENLAGGSNSINSVVCREIKKYLDRRFGHLPVMWVAATGVNARRVHKNMAFDLPGVRLLVRKGINGADDCLAEVLTLEPTSRRCHQIIIVGGDRRMTKPALELKARGCRIVVVGIEGSISTGLKNVADEIHYFRPYKQVRGRHMEGQ